VTAAAPRGRVAVTGIGVAAPWGDDPAAAVAGGPPLGPGGDWFDVRTQLAPRGYKYLPPACQYLLAAAKRARPREAVTGAGLGVVIGTNRACSAVHAAMDRTILTADASMLSPALAPFFSINVVASRLSIEHDCRAFNLTLTSPAVAGLESVQVAARALALGRARAVFAGATEAAAAAPDASGQPAEAGSAVLLLERPESAAERDAPVFGTCCSRALFVPPHSPDRARAALAAVWDELAGRDETPPTLFADGSPVADAVARALGELAGGVSVLPLGAGCVGPAWHVAGLLAAGGAPALVAVAHRTGHVVLTAVRPTAEGSR
jgi:3-oxoacyl-[acyl-carrier-protein] synthase II